MDPTKNRGIIGKIVLFFNRKKKEEIQVEEALNRAKKSICAKITVMKISERMKAREKRWKAEAKRQRRYLKRAKISKIRMNCGLVSDDDFGIFKDKPPRMRLRDALL